jgi:uncharacterized membrane protein YdcZ (DUF606 family)
MKLALSAAIAAGLLIAVQSALIGAFGERVHPFVASTWIHAAGLVVGVLGILLSRLHFEVAAVRQAPWTLFAGIAGILLVTAIAVAVGGVGLATTLAVVTAVQLLAGFALEASGILGRTVALDPVRLRSMPVGTLIHNVELTPGRGGQMGRSAGTSIQLVAKEGKSATLRLPSGEMRMVLADCRATIGALGNAEHELVELGKAGRSRHRGKRPQTRGVAMNPVDHPHGGGEGKSTPGRAPVTPWGKITQGSPTRKKHKRSDAMIVRRRRKGRRR